MEKKKKLKVLVTGSSGFLGSHLADTLTDNKYDVVLFDKRSSKYKKRSQEERVGDITIFNDVNDAIKDCSYVFHFAGQADIDISNESIDETLKQNIIGTQTLLEASLKNKIKRFFFASTIYVYSDLGSFYRISKQTSEKLVQEYKKQFNLDYTILRYGSIYGPRANKFNSLNNMLIQALNEKKIVRYGDGQEIREYIHVFDAALLTKKALSKKYINKSILITGQQRIKIKDLLKMIVEILQGDVEIEYKPQRELHHYQITPYFFEPEIAKKIIPKSHYELGQGILDLIQNLSKEKQFKNLFLNQNAKKYENY